MAKAMYLDKKKAEQFARPKSNREVKQNDGEPPPNFELKFSGSVIENQGGMLTN